MQSASSIVNRGDIKMTLYAGNLVGQTGSDGTVATGVAANYLKATSPFTNFGTRQLAILSVAYTGADTTPTITNSLFSQGVRALQQNAEVYAVYTPGSGAFIAIVAYDTEWDGQVSSASTISDASFAKLEAAVSAGITGAPTVTITQASVAGTTLTFA